MGILSDWFDVDPETEKDIKDIVKTVSLIAILIGGADAVGDSLELPFDDEKEEKLCVHCLDGSIIKASSHIKY